MPISKQAARLSSANASRSQFGPVFLGQGSNPEVRIRISLQTRLAQGGHQRAAFAAVGGSSRTNSLSRWGLLGDRAAGQADPHQRQEARASRGRADVEMIPAPARFAGPVAGRLSQRVGGSSCDRLRKIQRVWPERVSPPPSARHSSLRSWAADPASVLRMILTEPSVA